MKRFVTLYLLLLMSLSSFSQKKQDYAIAFKSDVLLDGKLVEWHDLTNVEDAGKWYYKVAHDDTNLYIAIRVQDSLLQRSVAKDGIVITFLAENKKKKNRSFIYPYLDNEVRRALSQAFLADPVAALKISNQALIQRTRGIKVSGFPVIVDGLLAEQNNYGLSVVIGSDEQALCYEAVVPKRLLAMTKATLEFEIQVKDSAMTAKGKKNKGKQSVMITGLRLQGQLIEE